MTRNVMLSFLQSLTTSKKQQKLQSSNTTITSSDCTLFGVSKSRKTSFKSKLKCEISEEAVNGKSKKKTSTKSKFFLRKSRSSNNVSSNLRSISPAIPGSNYPPSYSAAATSTNSATIVYEEYVNQNANDEPTERRSLSKNVSSENVENSTHSSVENDLSAKYQSEGTSTKSIVSNRNAMLKPSNMAKTPNGHPTQDYLQLPVNLSSNSSSVKSIASKSTDGICTEKKRKILSSGQQKKFHRHFKQLPQDENVLNHFSCAFVSDILLQGYLYVTNHHIAFYSNVFGYITKLLIPITSVVRISKEKTVKIIPNAIAVATDDERHVFSSFLSREAAYQLMVSVWKEALPMCDIHITASAAQLVISTVTCEKYKTNSINVISNSNISPDKMLAASISNTLQVHQKKRNSNSGLSELEDESSSAISVNESLTQLLQSGHLICNEQTNNDASSSNSNPSKGDLSAKQDSSSELDKTLVGEATLKATLYEKPIRSVFTWKIPRTIHIAYFALALVMLLALMAAFLFYRIAELKNARFKPFAIDELYKDPSNVDLYAEALKWQKDMQAQRIHLTKNVLTSHLEQIAEISDSLQTLSSLIVHSEEDNAHLNDKLSSIMNEYNNLETCVQRENLDNP